MATREITISFPEDTADRFLRQVSPARRSSYIVELVEAKMREREAMLLAACDVANADPETLQIQREFDALPDTMTVLENGHDVPAEG